MSPVIAALLVAVAAGAPAAGPFAVAITNPVAGTPAFGQVDVEARVTGPGEVRRVVLFVDGRRVGESTRPPYVVSVDLGQENVGHSFRAVATTSSGVTAEAVLTTPRIQIDQEVTFELQQLYVTVTRRDRRLLDLGPDDFRILDEEVPQQLLTFGRGDVPLTAVVLLDASISMRGERLAAAVAGARAFFAGMRGLDEGKLVVYADRVLLATPFTNIAELLTAGLAGVKSRGGTALADHVALSLQQLDQRQGRRVIVLLSDGVDTHSVLPTSEVLAKARQSQTLLYWIRLHDATSATPGDMKRDLYSPWHDAAQYEAQVEQLAEAARLSGGGVATVHAAAEIGPAFATIMQELREQYALGYYPSSSRNDGSWHPVRVEVGTPGAQVHARDGYLDY